MKRAGRIQVYKGRNGWRWRVLAGNGQPVYTPNQRFANKGNAVRSAKALMRWTKGAVLEVKE